MDLTRKESYVYNLPEELIAQYPLEKRNESRLLVLRKSDGNIEHRNFSNILDYLQASDLLVINNTKVIPARLLGKKTSGGKAEVFLLNHKHDDYWECLVKPGRRVLPGNRIIFSDKIYADIIEYTGEGQRLVKFTYQGNFWELLDEVGNMPLPPYILRNAEMSDKTRYQTVYARHNGSVAAPTAGLHFTDEILEEVAGKGIEVCEVLLHVGLGTFRPVTADNIADHVMHSEFCEIPEKTAMMINKAKEQKRRIIAVGTTTTRTLESFAVQSKVDSGSKWTDIFIYPGKELKIIDGLVTNFHMPGSTLLMLVSAFAGYENIMKAYNIAVAERYRFFSYGDAMLIIP